MNPKQDLIVLCGLCRLLAGCGSPAAGEADAGTGSAEAGDSEADAMVSQALLAAQFVEYGRLRLNFSIPVTDEEISDLIVTDRREMIELPITSFAVDPDDDTTVLVQLGSYHLPVEHGLALRVEGEPFELTLPGQSNGSRVAFISSSAGTGDLRSWPAGGGAGTPREAADAVCQSEAEAAGLQGTFVAYLGSEGNDASCRARGLEGDRDDDCGSASLPVDDGLFIGIDRRPIVQGADAIDDLNWLQPIRLQLDGNPTEAKVWVAADIFGSESGGDCEGWTSSSSDHIATAAWLASDYIPKGSNSMECSENNALYCVQVGDTFFSEAELHKSDGLKVFVSAAELEPGFGATEAQTPMATADALCSEYAADAGLSAPTGWHAWLGDSQDDAACRILGLGGKLADNCGLGDEPVGGPWVRTDGAPLAADLADLVDGRIDFLLNQDERGNVLGQAWTFTGTGWTGESWPGHSCNDWSDAENTSNAMGGRTVSAGGGWSQGWAGGCNRSAHLICFAH